MVEEPRWPLRLGLRERRIENIAVFGSKCRSGIPTAGAGDGRIVGARMTACDAAAEDLLHP